MVWIAQAGRLTPAAPHAMVLRTIREAAMRAQALPHAIPVDQVDLEALERFLMSDHSPRTLIAADWAEGFLQAIILRMDAWERLLKSKRDGRLLMPILALCSDESGESLLGLPPEDEDRIMEEVAEFIPACVTAIAAYWRGRGPKQISMALMGGPPLQPYYASSKVGRNDLCPCGSERNSRNAVVRRLNTPSAVLSGWLHFRRWR